MMKFPIDFSLYKPLRFSLSQKRISRQELKQLEQNIQLVSNAIVFMTAYANAKGLSGHTGGAYDIVPEVLIADAFIKGNTKIVPILFDEAGHRVAIQYVMAMLNGYMKAEKLLHYREYNKGLYGHPERDEKRGIFFSSGRLGHLWSYVNGVAEQNPNKHVIVFSSDGSQQEGNDAEAARYCVAQNLNVVVVVDDNNVTIEGHPRDYLNGYDVDETLRGHGLHVDECSRFNLQSLYKKVRAALLRQGPTGLVIHRRMAQGLPNVSGKTKAHEAISVEDAIVYLKRQGELGAVEVLESFVKKKKQSDTLLGSNNVWKKNRSEFGSVVVDILKKMPVTKRKKNLVISCDLGGSTGLATIAKKFPKLYRKAGIMERNNFSVAAGFGSKRGYQGIIGTFSAFSEMVISEISMARLNGASVLTHFSHVGVDDMADNTCHFGINAFFCDNEIEEQRDTRLYYPSDAGQLRACVTRVFHDKGLRFIFSPRSATPQILDSKGKLYYSSKYRFVPGRDDLIRSGKEGYIVSFGSILYRVLDCVERLRKEGIKVGLVNKSTLNVIDEAMMKKLSKAKFVLVVEDQNVKTGLGSRFGTWLLERGFKGKYKHIGVSLLGKGGLGEQVRLQGLDSRGIEKALRKLL